MKTVVVQAWVGNRPRFIGRCLDTVHDWARLHGFDYRFETDALLADVPDSYRRQVSGLVLPMTNLGRLLLLRRVLESGCERVVWCDADVVIFNPTGLHLRETHDYALTREVWTDTDRTGSVRHTVNITSCFMMFERENSFLDFAAHALTQRAARDPVSEPRGEFTRMLTELGAVVPLNTVREIGMMSPLLMDEVARGTPRHLVDYMETVGVPLCGINLASAFHNLVHKGVRMRNVVYERVIERALSSEGAVFNRFTPHASSSSEGPLPDSERPCAGPGIHRPSSRN